MTEKFKFRASGNTDPASDGFSITPNDIQELPTTVRALYVGSTGDIVVVMADGSALTFTNVPSGTILPIRIKAVKATGTNAANLIGLA